MTSAARSFKLLVVDIRIRPIEVAKDIEEITSLYFNTVHAINSKHYTPTQIAAWAPRIESPDYWTARWDNCHVFVAEAKSKIAGFTEFRPSGEVDCFYVHKDYGGFLSQIL